MPTVTLNVNGAAKAIDAWDPAMPLLYALRNDLGLHAAKFGCGLGQCGACTVLLDDAPVRSCTIALKDAAGHRIVTAEGLGTTEQAASGAGGVHRRAGGAVRLLHQRHGDEHGRAAASHAAADARAGAAGARRQPVPLRLARPRPARGAARGRRDEDLSMAARLDRPPRAAPTLTRRALLEAGALVVGFAFAPAAAGAGATPPPPRRATCRSTRSIPSSPSAATARSSSTRARSISAPATASPCARWSARSSASASIAST